MLKNFIKNDFTFNSNFYIQYNKNDIPKKGKATLKAFCKFQKNLHLGFGVAPTSVERDIPFPCLQSVQILLIYNIFAIFTYLLIACFIQKSILNIFVILLKIDFRVIKS